MVPIVFGTLSPASRIRCRRPPQNNTTFIARFLFPNVADSSYGHATRGAPAHGRVESTLAKQLLNSCEPDVPRKHLWCQPLPNEAVVELFDAAAHGPLGYKAGN